MKTFILVTLFGALSFSLSAQTFLERAQEIYLETDKNYELRCVYAFNKSLQRILPVSETKKTANELSREFIMENSTRTVPMSFKVFKKGTYSILMDQTHESIGKVPSQKDFYIAPIKDKKFAEEFETSKIYCYVDFAYALPFSLKDKNYHINVHPHKIYDWQNRLKEPVEKYLNNSEFESIVLLESSNNRGDKVNVKDVLESVDYKLPLNRYDSDLTEVPLTTPLIVSPAGTNRYHFDAETEVTVTFSGGNHNYCIWNNTLRIMEALMYSRSEAKLNFRYDMNAIVAQTDGIEKMRMNFSKADVAKSNLLKDLLSKKEVQKSYHPAYLKYYQNEFSSEFSGMYKTLKFNYSAPGFETSFTLNGNGTRDLEVNFIYF